ncbi:MAG TPA: hypothetical protein ENF52_06935 [Chloroflexi bacterium]|nr:hypothetical protein [Chloroflexota bacterium]
MRENPERLAWFVLLTSFFICIGLAVAIPLGIRHYIYYSQVKQPVRVEVQQPTLSITLAGRGLPLSVHDTYDDLPDGSIVQTGGAVGHLVTYFPHQDEQGNRIVAVTIQLYENSGVVFESARSPRFSVSTMPHTVSLKVTKGRVRISISKGTDRPTTVHLRTDHATVTLSEGTYWITVDPSRTEITVRYGQAQIRPIADDQILSLDRSERAIVETHRIVGPLSSARDLIQNGDFTLPLEEGWQKYNRDIQIPGEPEGEVTLTEVNGRTSVLITRQGMGHLETGITQEINTYIRDFSFLQLHLLLNVIGHNVPVCGSLGSECPIMVRIDYRDADGNERQWLQGFYTLPDPATPGNPSFCVTCNIRNEHIQVPANTWYSYDSENLIPALSHDGQGPTLIKSITIYASGHSYQSAIAEVELIGQE